MFKDKNNARLKAQFHLETKHLIPCFFKLLQTIKTKSVFYSKSNCIQCCSTLLELTHEHNLQ